MPAYGVTILVAGPSGGGKSTIATGLIERLAERRYTFVVIDPEGDYDELGNVVVIGTSERPPTFDEVTKLLGKPGESCVVNLLAIPLADRPAFFVGLRNRLEESRSRTGRPHWVVLDEAHHLLPAPEAGSERSADEIKNTVLITVHPGMLLTSVLQDVSVVIALGEAPDAMLAELALVTGTKAPEPTGAQLETGQALVWFPGVPKPPVRLQMVTSRTQRRRHTRKYAEGELGPDKSFYFRGPDDALNLRAQNFVIFLQIADGVDDATWMYHLDAHHYSGWIRDAVKDGGLADRIFEVESTERSPAESRRLIREAIESDYTLPAARGGSAAPGQDHR